jgi:hypothetical protein
MIIFIIFLLNILQSKSIILKDFSPRPKQLSNVLNYRTPLYTIISKDTNSINELIDFMNSNNLRTFYINKDLLNDQSMNNIENKIPSSFINKEPLIFEDDVFVGSYFEIYNQIKYI